MVPTKFDDAPKEADVPIAQKTLDALALLISLNDVAVDVVKDVSVRKVNLAFASPLASRVMVAAEKVNLPVAEQYTPGVKRPPARSLPWMVWLPAQGISCALVRRARVSLAQLIAGMVFLSVAEEPVNSKLPDMTSPGATPTVPVTVVTSPLKLTAVPAFTAKLAHLSTSRKSAVDNLTLVFFRAVTEEGLSCFQASDPLSKTMAVFASTLPFNTA
mmetsp:Transcript_15177/g.14576  ORF Transcript_15177/g.14576 Transcript_15177/m.14576 type:complete len:216 (+) Transcript_15177:512-1159(+)